jgi:hypothetical protein
LDERNFCFPDRVQAIVLGGPSRIFGTAAAGIGIVNSAGNSGGYVGPSIPKWARLFSSNPFAAFDIIAAIFVLGVLLTYSLIITENHLFAPGHRRRTSFYLVGFPGRSHSLVQLYM